MAQTTLVNSAALYQSLNAMQCHASSVGEVECFLQSTGKFLVISLHFGDHSEKWAEGGMNRENSLGWRVLFHISNGGAHDVGA